MYAPSSIMPSRPMLSTPARSEIVSPSAVNISGTPASSPPAITLVQNTSVQIWLARITSTAS